METACRHCAKPLATAAPRGLCYPCYRKPAVRELYGRTKPGPKSPADAEPSAEELERIVAEQLAHLPAWWENSSRVLERQRVREPKVYRIVKCG